MTDSCYSDGEPAAQREEGQGSGTQVSAPGTWFSAGAIWLTLGQEVPKRTEDRSQFLRDQQV